MMMIVRSILNENFILFCTLLLVMCVTFNTVEENTSVFSPMNARACGQGSKTLL